MQSAVYIRGMKKLALAAYSHSPRAEIVYARGAADKYDKGVRQSEGVYIYIYIYMCARARMVHYRRGKENRSRRWRRRGVLINALQILK